MSWWYLLLAGLFEVVWAAALKYTDGFTKPLITAFTVAAMVVSVGRCAERRMNFGCQSYIPAGARAAGPYVAGGHRVARRCAD